MSRTIASALAAIVLFSGSMALAQDQQQDQPQQQGQPQKPKDDRPGLTEQLGAATGNAAGTVAGTAVGGPVVGAVGGVVGGVVGQTAGKVVHKVVHHKKKKPADDAPSSQQMARADTQPANAQATASGDGSDRVTDDAPRAVREPVGPPQPTPTPADDSTTYQPKTDDAPRSPG